MRLFGRFFDLLETFFEDIFQSSWVGWVKKVNFVGFLMIFEDEKFFKKCLQEVRCLIN
jgi:hypothetical protein